MDRSVRPDNVEFTVQAEEDLVLVGKERSIVRVSANDMYACLMQKTQRFSSLFRHYSKHHGLPREALEFFFTGRLDPEDTPDSVHLQKNDIILVRKRSSSDSVEELPKPDDALYFKKMKELLDSGRDSDIVFEVGPKRERISAHRIIITTRCEFFSAMFRKCAMRESEEGCVVLEDHTPQIVSKMLEFIYTNRVENLMKCSYTEIIELLSLAEQYLLAPLKQICEIAGNDLITNENVARLLSAAQKYNADTLKEFCLKHIISNVSQIVDDDSFRSEIQDEPSLAISILKATASVIPSSAITQVCGTKRRRLSMPFDYEEEF